MGQLIFASLSHTHYWYEVGMLKVRRVALRNLGIVDQNWLKRIRPICCWERWPWLGDSNPSRSRLLSIWSKGGLINRFVIGRCHRLQSRIIFCRDLDPCRLSSGLSRCDPLTLVPLCDHVPDWQPRILLGMVEARSVNVKNTTTTQFRFFFKLKPTGI